LDSAARTAQLLEFMSKVLSAHAELREPRSPGKRSRRSGNNSKDEPEESEPALATPELEFAGAAPAASRIEVKPRPTLSFRALGGAGEVGGSSHLLDFGSTRLLVDAGIKPDGRGTSAPDFKAVEALDKKVKDLTDDIKKVREEKDRLELLVNGSKDGFGQPGLVKRLEKAEADLKAMDEKMKSLEEKLATKTTSEKTTLPSAMVGKGKVVLVNEFRTKLSVMVNGTSYPLDPSQTKDVLVPFGDFTYELVEFPNAAPVKSSIKEGETVTLRIK
ncbi:MAG: hypothetical protein ABGY75_01525, partial [Gemmataceae bacterium]